MDVVQVLPELANGPHGTICDESTLRQDEVSQARSRLDDTFHRFVPNIFTGRQIQYAQAIHGVVSR